MNNTLALILAVIIVACVAIDVSFYGTEHMVFLGKRLADLIEWLAFWR